MARGSPSRSGTQQSPLKRRKKARPTRRAPMTAQLQVRTYDVRARPRVHPELLGTATCHKNTADVGDTEPAESVSRRRFWAAQCALHTATLAAQWWA